MATQALTCYRPPVSPFHEKQLSHNAVHTSPKTVLAALHECASCIFQEMQLYNLYVVVNHSIRAYPIRLDEKGISLEVDHRLFGPVQRLHDLFSLNGCPAHTLYYEHNPQTLAEYVYRTMLPKAWKLNSEWVVDTFKEHTVVASAKGIVATKKTDLFAKGNFHSLFNLELAPCSLHSPPLLYSVSRHLNERDHKFEIAILGEIKERYKKNGLAPHYCLLPHLLTRLQPKKQIQALAICIKATAGTLEFIQNDLQYAGRIRGAKDILMGIREQFAIGMCHRDLKMRNIVALSKDPDNPQLRLIDLSDNFPKKRISRRLILSLETSSPRIIKKYREEGEEHKLTADEFYKDSLYSWGAIFYELISGEQALFDRNEEETLLKGEPLPVERVAADPFFHDEIKSCDASAVKWKKDDCFERLIWDAMMWEHADETGSIARPLSIDTALSRLETLAAEQNIQI